MNETYYLSLAGFTLKLTFKPTEQIYLKDEFIENLKKVWRIKRGRRGTKQKTDFETIFLSGVGNPGILQKNKRKDFYLIFDKDFNKKKILVYQYPGLTLFQALLKEILLFLLEGTGFILHASSCLDRKRTLSVFMAVSGGGKTTTAALLSQNAGYVKFSDDYVIVRKVNGKVRYFSPPFVEKKFPPENKIADRAIFYFIKKSKKPYKKEMTNHHDIMKKFLGMTWLQRGIFSSGDIKTLSVFVSENKFFGIGVPLNKTKIRKLVS